MCHLLPHAHRSIALTIISMDLSLTLHRIGLVFVSMGTFTQAHGLHEASLDHSKDGYELVLMSHV